MLAPQTLAEAKLLWRFGNITDVSALSDEERSELDAWTKAVVKATPRKTAYIKTL